MSKKDAIKRAKRQNDECEAFFNDLRALLERHKSSGWGPYVMMLGWCLASVRSLPTAELRDRIMRDADRMCFIFEAATDRWDDDRTLQ